MYLLSRYKGYGVIIDTDVYTGSFERELCAYLTNKIGSNSIASEYRKHDLIINFNTKQFQVSKNIKGYSSIYPSPYYFNNCLGDIYCYEDNKSVNIALDNWKKYFKNQNAPNDIINNLVLEDYPAYNSIILFFKDQPTEIELEALHCRLKMFFEKYNFKCNILNIRVEEFNPKNPYEMVREYNVWKSFRVSYNFI